MADDEYTLYEKSVRRLLKQVKNVTTSEYNDILVLKSRLEENIHRSRVYGKTENLDNERAQILLQVEKMSREITGKSLTELSKETSLPEKSSSSTEPIIFSRIFPGLMSFDVSDESMFFGREREIAQLLKHIQEDPIVIVNGLSGCGKSSLIKAGVIPELQKLNYYTLYVTVFENIIQEICQKVHFALNSTGTANANWVESIQELHRKESKKLVLIIDQFEQALKPERINELSVETFIKGLSRLVSENHQRVTIVIALRADWLYYLETSVQQFYPRLNVHSYIFTLTPLTKNSALDAITKPMKIHGLFYDKETIAQIVDSLQCNSIIPAIDYYIQPIQLQIVLRALYSFAEQIGTPDTALTPKNYQALGGVENILRNYLIQSIGRRTNSWKILARFISSDGQTSQIIHQAELLEVPAAENINVEIRFLIEQGFIVAQETNAPKEYFYRLTHDYLVKAIVDYLDKNPDQQGWKLAEDWLSRGLIEWNESKKKHQTEELLLEKGRYLQIYQQRDNLKITEKSQMLLILTSLHYGHAGLGYWINRNNHNLESKVKTVTEKLLSPIPDVQNNAQKSPSGCTSIKTLKASENLFQGEALNLLSKTLLKKLNDPTSKQQRNAAAQALWILNKFETVKERAIVSSIVFMLFINKNIRNILLYVSAIFLVMGVFGIRERLRGTWELFYTLKSGDVPVVAIDPLNSKIVYVITKGGMGPREGNSLFVRQENGGWELVSRDFSKANPTSLAIVKNKETSQIFISLYGKGIIRSDNSGKDWHLANSGLPSRGITSVAINPKELSTIYAGTDDWRGVLKSVDGGNSWAFYDIEGEIYGATITRIAYTQANGGVLIAGTGDGRLLLHFPETSNWELSHSLSKGAISSIEVAYSNNNYIYAGTSRGIILRSKDGGKNWQIIGQVGNELQNEFSVTNIAVSYDNPNKLFVSSYGNGGYKVWKSVDMGQHWELLPARGLPRTAISALEISTSKEGTCELLAGTATGLFISNDEGNSWQMENLMAPLASIKQVAIHPQKSSPIYAVVGGTIYSNLAGDLKTWIHGQGLQAEYIRSIVVDPTNSDIAYAGVMLLGEWSVFRTKDGGQMWERTSTPLIEPIIPDTTALSAALSENGSTVLYAGTLGCGLLKSTDQGNTWDTFGRSHCSQIPKEMPTDISFLTIDAANSNIVYAATGQWLYTSYDGGQQWISYQLETNLGINSPVIGLVADTIVPDKVYMVTRSNGFWASENNGKDWESRGSRWFKNIEPAAIATIPGKTGNLIIGTSTGGVIITANGGKSWRSIRENLEISNITSIATSKDLNGKIILSTQENGIAVFTPGQILP